MSLAMFRALAAPRSPSAARPHARPAASSPVRSRALRPLPALALAAAAALALLPLRPAAAATDVQVVTSPGGITAWLVEEHSIPMLAMEMQFRGGASREPADKPGVTDFLAHMFDEGAGDLDSAAYSARADRLALRAGFSAGRDGFNVSAAMLTESRDASVDLLRLALTEPRFDPDAMERVRNGLLSGLAGDETDPGAILGRAWRKALFGDDPYGREVAGTTDSIAAMTPEDLRAMRAVALNRDGLAIGVVGDITAEALGPLLDRLLGDLPDAPLPDLPRAELSADRSLEVIPLDVPQSVATLVAEGLDRHDPDFIPAYVMNHILGGGGFTSRLTEEVREKRGLTYSVYSYLAPYDRAALIASGISSANARIGEAIEVIKAEFARMRDGGATADELDKAQRYLTGAYPLRFDSNGKIAGQLAGLMADGFEPDYIENRNAMIEAVTLDDIARVAKRLLDPAKLKVVVVGQPEGLAQN
ncbi:MAG: pitrilysin family protein [Pseudomonadota bacterium]|nr:pitrilysin family protein [Pseudomonadota bacterium]